MSALVAMGDRAVRFAIPRDVDRAALLAELRADERIVDVVLAEETGLAAFATASDRDVVEHAVRAALRAPARRDAEAPRRLHRVEVVYDGEDLDEVAAATGLTRAEVVERHARATYEVAMLGFLPGFAYLRGLAPELVLPRRATPRVRVPAGSLAIAAEYTGIYPFASPGGWHLLGRVADAIPIFSPAGGARFSLGDHVALVPTSKPASTPAPDVEPRVAPTRPAFEIARVKGPALLVDGGRPGRAHEGIPAGGPLVPRAFVRANEAAGNRGTPATIEVYGAIEIRTVADVVVADDEGRVLATRAGETVTVEAGARKRVAYVAIGGGIDAPRVLGGRGALLVARIGAPLRRGDTFAIAEDEDATRLELEPDDDVITVLPGPDEDAPALDRLGRATFRVAREADRTGTRLEGPELPKGPANARRRSAPMVLGAVQRTPTGFVVLGPDHPTTGGYPVVAVVAASSRSAFFGRPIGAEIRFRIASRR